MADVHSRETRSYNMSQIHGKDTKPEEKVRKYLFLHGFRYRKNVSSLPGKPDIVLPKYKTVVFVNGCFWHCHKGCRYYVFPKTNIEFWSKKFHDNVIRDQANYIKLKELGWHVVIVWECELKKAVFEKNMENLTHRIRDGEKAK